MSSGKATRVADKTVYLRPLGKTALQLYVTEHYQKTGERLKEWQAWEMIVEGCLPDLYKRAVDLEKRAGNGEGNGKGTKK